MWVFKTDGKDDYMSVNGILLGQNNNNIEISEQNFQSFRTAGSYSYTIPKTGWYYILMSGGGGGSSGGWPRRKWWKCNYK